MRYGVAFAMPINRRLSVRFSHRGGAYTRVGGDFQSLGVSYTYVWRGVYEAPVIYTADELRSAALG